MNKDNKLFGEFKLMNSDDIVKLVKEYQDTGDETLLEKILEQQYNFVKKVARKYYKGDNAITYDLEDMIHVGLIGVLKAVERFDPESGYKLTTYSYWWIKQSIARFVNMQDDMYSIGFGENKIRELNKYRSFIIGLSEDEVIKITDKELSEKLNISESNIKEFRSTNNSMLRLESKVKCDEDTTFQEVLLSSEDNMYNQIIISELIDNIMVVLSDREKYVILQTYGFIDGEPKPLSYIADEYDISRERVRQIKEKGLKKLRERIRYIGLKEYDFYDVL